MEMKMTVLVTISLLIIIPTLFAPIHAVYVQGRVGALPLNPQTETGKPGEDDIFSSVIDPIDGFAYFGAHTGVIVKVRLSDFTRVSSLTMNNGETALYTAVIDSQVPSFGSADFAYFGTCPFGTAASPGVVVKTRLSDLTRVGSLTMNTGENCLSTSIIDHGHGFAYFGTSSTPGVVVKIRLSDFTRAGALTLNSGENFLGASVIDTANGFAYFGTFAGTVVKVRLSDFTRVGALNLNSGHLSSSVIDTDHGFAYFGTSDGIVVKVRLSDFTRVGVLTVEYGQDPLISAVTDGSDIFPPTTAYFGTGTNPGYVIAVRLTDFTEVGALQLYPGENNLASAVIDIYNVGTSTTGGFAYFGTTQDDPGIVVKVDITGHSGSFFFGFSLSNAGNVAAQAGSSGKTYITATLTIGTAPAIILSCVGSTLPSGASCSFSPSSLTPTGSSVLTISTTPNTPWGLYQVEVTASPPGAAAAPTTLTLIVGPPDANCGGDAGNTFDTACFASLSNNYTGAIWSGVNVIGSIQPWDEDWYKFDVTSGQRINVTVAPNPSAILRIDLRDPLNMLRKYSDYQGLFPGKIANVTFVADMTGSWRARIFAECNGYPNCYNGPYSFVIKVTSPPPPPPFDYSLSNSGGIFVSQGFSDTTTITSTLTSGSPQSVTLSCVDSTLPTGVSCSFDPSAVNPSGSSVLTISTSSSTPLGLFHVNVTGGPLGPTTTPTAFTLAVIQPLTISLSASPSPPDGTAPLTVSFTAEVTGYPPGSCCGVEWQFGDGTSSTSGAWEGSRFTVVHVYESPGTFNATLTAIYARGSEGAARELVIVKPPPVIVTTPSATRPKFDSGESSTISTTFSGGAPPYICQWLQRSPDATSYSNLGSSFSCNAGATLSNSTGALSALGTWSFELSVTDSYGSVVNSTGVSLIATGSLKIIVSTSANSPIQGAIVTIISAPLGQTLPTAATTGPDGIATFSGLVAGQYTYMVTANGYQDWQGSATVPAEQLNAIQLNPSFPWIWLAVAIVIVVVLGVTGAYVYRRNARAKLVKP